MSKQLTNVPENNGSKVIVYAELALQNIRNELQAGISKMLPCEFCHTDLRQDLLHHHQITCSHNPAIGRILSKHTNTQHHRPPFSPPIPPRMPISPPIPPRRPSHSQPQNPLISTAAQTSDLLRCPITSDIFRDPVLAEDGHTYERQAIVQWIRMNGTSPITQQPLQEAELRLNYTVQKLADELRSRNTPH